MISNEDEDEDGNNKHCDDSEVGVVVFMMPSLGKNEKNIARIANAVQVSQFARNNQRCH